MRIFVCKIEISALDFFVRHKCLISLFYYRNWLEGELEVVTVKKQAKQSLENLMDDRKTISDQINKAKVNFICIVFIVTTNYM